MHIILASTSPYRKAILDNLGIPHTTTNPAIDETPQAGEPPAALVARLAATKASAVAADNDSYIIGSDQIATLDGDILGKPHSVENAIAQLKRFSGREVQFLTGIAIKHRDTIKTHVEPYTVQFRELSDSEIRHYIDKEQPLNCAGSFKSEGLGILLFSALKGRDPNALIGLPVIALNELFLAYGINLLTTNTEPAALQTT